MDLRAEGGGKQVSVLQGDGICISRILARESSVGQSSRIFYRSAEGVPFRWEMQPGTPKNPQEDEDFIPPICPSPLMQSLGLPLPNLDCYDDDPALKTSKIRRLKEMVKKRINIHDIIGRSRRRSKQHESSSTFSSSPSSTSDRVVDVSMAHAPFCCTPWNTPAILEEGNTRIYYYCSQHKNAFAVEEDDLFLSRIFTGVSAAEHFSGPLHGETPPSGIPFGWEMQPGKPKASPENELIPPPSPPPAVQSLCVARPSGRDNKGKKSAMKKAWFWIRRYVRKKESKKMVQHEISFRYDVKMEEGFDAPSLRKSASVSSASSISPLSKGGWRVSKIRRDFEGRCGPWSRRDVLVFATRKWKSFTS